MDDAGVVGERPRERFENGGCLELARVRLVRQIDGLVERESIEHRSLSILWIALVKLRHRRLVLRGARLLIDRGVVLEENAERLYPIAFPLGRRIRGASLLDGLPACLQQRRRKWRDQWVGALADRHAPIGHGAGGLGLGDGAERLDGLRKEKGVEHRDRAIELPLRIGAA